MTSPCLEIEEFPFQISKGVLGSLPVINRKDFVVAVLVLAFGFFGLLLLSCGPQQMYPGGHEADRLGIANWK